MKRRKKPWTHAMGISSGDAMRLARELMERIAAPGLYGVDLINCCRDVISLGREVYHEAKRSVSFRYAAEVSLQEREGRRARTTREIRLICRRIMRELPQLAEMSLREMSATICHEALKQIFHTDLQFAKARAVLHSIFACGIRHGWCAVNPISLIPRPELKEAEVEPLPWKTLKSLLSTAAHEPHQLCMPALGMMLWAGVRPAELTRLHWDDIDWQERVICIRPQHSKTGGCRHITLHPVLAAWLKRCPKKEGSICPPNWLRRWKALRRAAGICTWQQDVLRHTFASYHLKHWHDLPRLQEEMGHRSARLLRTRYLSMRGITSCHAKEFWTPGKLGQ